MTSLLASSNRNIPVGAATPYRTEIDGLRALAVAAVVINHFNKTILPGGYLGVDIFFVISGYVITKSLANHQSVSFGAFVSGFYARRVKRLLPALLLYTLVAGILICLFNPFPTVSLRTGIAALFGFSNLYLLKQSTDYFAVSSDLNIYTHTWSLGVEEQFYILYPLILYIAKSIGPSSSLLARTLFLTMVVLSIASLICFLIIYPVNQSAGFFLMPTRFWEIGSGCLLALASKHSFPWLSVLWTLPPLAITGALVGVLFVPLQFTIPATVTVVALTFCLIACLRPGTLAFTVFTQKTVVYIGLISYSLYLWHWGVLSISRWTIGVHWWTVPFQLALIQLLSVYTYRHVESPFRRYNFSFPKWIIIAYGFFISLLGGAFLALLDSKLYRYLYLGDNDLRASIETQTSVVVGGHVLFSDSDCNRISEKTISKCYFPPLRRNTPTLLLLGDSHSEHLYPLLGRLRQNFGVGVSGFSDHGESGLFPSIALELTPHDKFFQLILPKLKPGDTVVLSSNLTEYFTCAQSLECNPASFDQKKSLEIADNKLYKLKTWVRRVSDFSQEAASFGVNVLLIAPLPMFNPLENAFPNHACTSEWFRPRIHAACPSSYADNRLKLSKSIGSLMRVLQPLSSRHQNLYIYDPFPVLCPANQLLCSSRHNDIVLYRDNNHLSRDGSLYLYTDFVEYLHRNNLLNADMPAHVP